jgi:hypothetical protein
MVYVDCNVLFAKDDTNLEAGRRGESGTAHFRIRPRYSADVGIHVSV